MSYSVVLTLVSNLAWLLRFSCAAAVTCLLITLFHTSFLKTVREWVILYWNNNRFTSFVQFFICGNKSWLRYRINTCILGQLVFSWQHDEDNHYAKSVRIRSYSGSYFPAFGPNRERYGISLWIQSEYGKMRTRITPNTDTLHAVTFWHLESLLPFWSIQF